ncbi:MAG: GNAT family N-acetyltransferase [Treponema sp.]|jgi:GNAT superfamily N-acetyltransferase|nr:GNAT family N-acetyltransferase [Treponema sp.]
MQFELSEALIGDLLFSMEDQMGDFYLDTKEGVIIGNEGIEDNEYDEFDDVKEDGDRYISLPAWDSTDGFRLMEHFTAGLRSPALRNELLGALNQGKGVFRSFKDTIARYPETEKLWFIYKEQGMRREILRWYNGLREEWGLERIGGEPEETGDLILEDFRFRLSKETDREAAAALHRVCIDELRAYAAEHNAGTAETPAFLALEQPDGWAWCFPGDLALTAETGNGDFAAYTAALRRGGTLYIHALEVQPQYRGLGIGKSLLSRCIEEARRRFAGSPGPEGKVLIQIVIDLPAGSEGFSQALFRDSFNPCMVRYCLEIPRDDGESN